MNITKIKLNVPGAIPINHATFNIFDTTIEDRYILKSATGLDAEEITPKLNGRANGLGTNYYDMILGDRTIVLSVKLNPNYKTNQTVSELKDNIYKAIAFNRTGKIQLEFVDLETTVAVIEGYVSKVESDPFSSDTTVNITIECEDPFFRGPDYIPVYHQDGEPSALTQLVWDDDLSTAPHGYTLEFSFLANVNNIVIKGIRTPNLAPFQINYSFLANDVLHLSSEYNDRYLWIQRYDQFIHLTDKIVPGSIWPMAYPGHNELGLSTNNTQTSIEFIHYKPAYWGL